MLTVINLLNFSIDVFQISVLFLFLQRLMFVSLILVKIKGFAQRMASINIIASARRAFYLLIV